MRKYNEKVNGEGYKIYGGFFILDVFISLFLKSGDGDCNSIILNLEK